MPVTMIRKYFLVEDVEVEVTEWFGAVDYKVTDSYYKEYITITDEDEVELNLNFNISKYLVCRAEEVSKVLIEKAKIVDVFINEYKEKKDYSIEVKHIHDITRVI